MSGGGGAMVNDSPWREISWASNPTVREAAKQDDETTDTAPSDPPPSLSELVKGRAGNSNFGRAGLVGRGLRMHSPPRRRQWARFSAHVAGRGVASHVRGRGQPRPVAVVAGNVDVAESVEVGRKLIIYILEWKDCIDWSVGEPARTWVRAVHRISGRF